MGQSKEIKNIMQDKQYSLDGKAILVTGGTGSFGQAFVKHVLTHHRPSRLVVYSRDELKQFEMQQKVSAGFLRFFIGDVRDSERLNRALTGIDIVVHAAALKQVPAAEYNPIECIKTNVIGAENVINACIDRKGEESNRALDRQGGQSRQSLRRDQAVLRQAVRRRQSSFRERRARFSVVRYGNVIGSRGSVVPFFKERVKEGKLPITDPRMTRFWIRLEDGARFVEQCLQVMRGGEIFIPKIPSMRITDLATAIGPDCKQETVGIRPGEKLHELLVTRDDARHTLEFNDFYIIQPDIHMWDYDNSAVYGKERGTPVATDFEYASDSNTQWLELDATEIRHRVIRMPPSCSRLWTTEHRSIRYRCRRFRAAQRFPDAGSGGRAL